VLVSTHRSGSASGTSGPLDAAGGSYAPQSTSSLSIHGTTPPNHELTDALGASAAAFHSRIEHFKAQHANLEKDIVDLVALRAHSLDAYVNSQIMFDDSEEGLAALQAEIREEHGNLDVVRAELMKNQAMLVAAHEDYNVARGQLLTVQEQLRSTEDTLLCTQTMLATERDKLRLTAELSADARGRRNEVYAILYRLLPLVGAAHDYTQAFVVHRACQEDLLRIQLSDARSQRFREEHAASAQCLRRDEAEATLRVLFQDIVVAERELQAAQEQAAQEETSSRNVLRALDEQISIAQQEASDRTARRDELASILVRLSVQVDIATTDLLMLQDRTTRKQESARAELVTIRDEHRRAQAAAAEEWNREALARAQHDSLTQSISAAKADLQDLEERKTRERAAADDQLIHLRGSISSAQDILASIRADADDFRRAAEVETNGLKKYLGDLRRERDQKVEQLRVDTEEGRNTLRGLHNVISQTNTAIDAAQTRLAEAHAFAVAAERRQTAAEALAAEAEDEAKIQSQRLAGVEGALRQAAEEYDLAACTAQNLKIQILNAESRISALGHSAASSPRAEKAIRNTTGFMFSTAIDSEVLAGAVAALQLPPHPSAPTSRHGSTVASPMNAFLPTSSTLFLSAETSPVSQLVSAARLDMPLGLALAKRGEESSAAADMTALAAEPGLELDRSLTEPALIDTLVGDSVSEEAPMVKAKDVYSARSSSASDASALSEDIPLLSSTPGTPQPDAKDEPGSMYQSGTSSHNPGIDSVPDPEDTSSKPLLEPLAHQSGAASPDYAQVKMTLQSDDVVILPRAHAQDLYPVLILEAIMSSIGGWMDVA
jgi:hypothetical protein